MNRDEIKNAHESSEIDSFKKHSASLGNIIHIISRPEPPDAIITINGGNPCWIEITDAFFSSELAESVTTYAADDKPQKPVSREKRFCIDPDGKFSSILEDVIVKKYKESIGSVYKKYGSGILLVGIINPFSGAKELANTEKKRIEAAIRAKEPRFHEVYLYDGGRRN